MKQFTWKEFSKLLQDKEVWEKRIRICSVDLDEGIFKDKNGGEVHIYINFAAGVVRYFSDQHGIGVTFKFNTSASGLSYKYAYDFKELKIDQDTIETLGFVLDAEAPNFVLAEIFSGRDWGSDVRRLLPTLP